jgi:hypothetical protein
MATDAIAQITARLVQAELDATERMLERMLVTPDAGGVRVHVWMEDDLSAFHVRAMLTHEVPFGTVERCPFPPPE